MTLVGIKFTSLATLVIGIFSHSSWIYWRRTSLLAAFCVCFWIAKSKLCQICSIGFISGDWLGHQSFCMPFSWCQACVVFAEWQGAPSSMKRWWFLSIWALAKIGRRPSLNLFYVFGRIYVIFTYYKFGLSIMPNCTANHYRKAPIFNCWLQSIHPKFLIRWSPHPYMTTAWTTTTTTTTTTTVYFNKVVFPSILGLTSPMAFPQHFSSTFTCPKHLSYKVPCIFFQHFSPSLPGPTFHSITIYLQCLNSSLSNTTHLFSQHDQTTSTCFVASLQQHHQLPACSSHTHYFSFHLNSLLLSISTSLFHSSVFSLYPLSLLAMSHCHTILQVLCMLYRYFLEK